MSISEHSGWIGISIKKGEKSLLIIFLSAKGAEGRGGGQSLADMLNSRVFFLRPPYGNIQVQTEKRWTLQNFENVSFLILNIGN